MAPRVEALLESRRRAHPRGGGLEVRECLRGLLEAAGVDGLLEASREHPGHALQAIARLAVAGVRRGGRAVVEQCVVAGRFGEAPLVHRQARLLEQVIDLALHDRGVGHGLRGRGGLGRARAGGGRRHGGRRRCC